MKITSELSKLFCSAHRRMSNRECSIYLSISMAGQDIMCVRVTVCVLLCVTECLCVWVSVLLCVCVCYCMCVTVCVCVCVTVCVTVSVTVCVLLNVLLCVRVLLCVCVCVCVSAILYVTVCVTLCVCYCICVTVRVCVSVCIWQMNLYGAITAFNTCTGDISTPPLPEVVPVVGLLLAQMLSPRVLHVLLDECNHAVLPHIHLENTQNQTTDCWDMHQASGLLFLWLIIILLPYKLWTASPLAVMPANTKKDIKTCGMIGKDFSERFA